MRFDLEENLRSILRQAVSEHSVAGASVLLYQEDAAPVCVCEGLADIERQCPIGRDTIFRLHSMTKPIIAAAALKLVEQGKLGLEDPVEAYIPAFRDVKVAPPLQARNHIYTTAASGGARFAGKKICIYHLLNMTSGLVYPDETTPAGIASGRVYEEIRLHNLMSVSSGAVHTHPLTTLEVAERFASCPLAYEPGASWSYGVSADVLGAVLEVAAGEKLSAYLKREIFDPLGMKDTAFGVPNDKRDRLATVYEQVSERNESFLRRYVEDELDLHHDSLANPAFESGGAGLCGTLEDYLQFARMLLLGGTVPEQTEILSSRDTTAQDAKQSKRQNAKEALIKSSLPQQPPAGSQKIAEESPARSDRILKEETVQYLTRSAINSVQQKAFHDVTMFSLGRYTYGSLMRKCLRDDLSPRVARCGEYGWGGQSGTDFMAFPKERAILLIGMQKKDARQYGLGKKIRNVVLKYL